MIIRLNGDEMETEAATLLQFLHEKEIIPERVAVEVNLKIIKRAEFERHPLHEGDVLEVVNFVGGGQKTAGSRQ